MIKMKKKMFKKSSTVLVMIAALSIGQVFGQKATAYKVNVPKTIDGDLSDWDFTADVNKASQMLKVDDASPWFPQDNSMVWKATWDANNLYLAIAVEDKEVVVSSIKTPEGISYCIGYDKKNKLGWGKTSENYGNKINVSASGEDPGQGGNFKSNAVLIRTNDVLGKGKPGYVVELSVPWTTVGNPVVDVKSKLLFEVQVQDYDRYKGNEKSSFKNFLGWATSDNVWQSMENVGVLKLSDLKE